MQVEKLGDICEIASGGTPKRSEDSYWKNGKIPWLKISDIKSKYIDKSEEHITQKGLDNSSAKLFKKGTIIYTIFATVGEVAILNIDATTNQAIAGLTIKNPDQINPSYLFYFLKSIKKQVHSLSRGVAQNNINLSVLRQIKVPIPDLNVQERIVNALDQMQNNIKLRQMELSKLDILIKARFVEMFGDPIINTKDLSLVSLGKLCTLKAGEFTAAKEIHANKDNINRYPCFGGNGVRGYVDNYTHDGNYSLIGRQGALCGNVQLTAGKFRNTEHAILVKPNVQVNYYWLFMLLKLEKLNRFSSGAAQPGLAVKTLNKIFIPIADLNLQNEFASFAQQVDKSKVVNASIMKYIISIRFYLYFKENKEGAR